MTIDQRCKSQQITADRMFMDFKYTNPGSKEQLRALKTLNTLVCQWVVFFHGDDNFDNEKFSLKETVFINIYYAVKS